MKLKSVVIFGSVLGVVVVVSVVLFLTAIWSSQGSSYVPNEVRDSKSCVAGGNRGVALTLRRDLRLEFEDLATGECHRHCVRADSL